MPTVETAAMNTNHELRVRFDKVREFKDQGYTIRAISRSVGISRVTIRKYLRMDFLPKKTGSRSTNFDAYQLYLLQATNAEKPYTDLHTDIVKQGFNGGYTQFCNNMNILLKRYKMTRTYRKSDPSIIKTWSAGKLSFLLQKEPKILMKEDNKFLNQLCSKYPVIKQTAKQVKQFKKLFKDKQEGSLQQWLDEVANYCEK
ncbi:hypothetical protein [Flavitalea sp.]|nr:hypothetical protein [Flavitalea sp.]